MELKIVNTHWRAGWRFTTGQEAVITTAEALYTHTAWPGAGEEKYRPQTREQEGSRHYIPTTPHSPKPGPSCVWSSQLLHHLEPCLVYSLLRWSPLKHTWKYGVSGQPQIASEGKAPLWRGQTFVQTSPQRPRDRGKSVSLMLSRYTDLLYGFLRAGAANWSPSILTEPSTRVERSWSQLLLWTAIKELLLFSFLAHIYILHFPPYFELPPPSKPQFYTKYVMTCCQDWSSPNAPPESATSCPLLVKACSTLGQFYLWD